MSEVETWVEPPDLEEEEDGDGRPHISLNLGLIEDDGTHRCAQVSITSDDDDQIAESLIDCLRGIAAMRGPGLQWALTRRLA